jgi:hypothetical protein
LEGAVPDHSTFSKNRHGRFRDSDLLRVVFEITVQRCIDAGLVSGEGFAVDASLIRADANKQRSADASETVDWEDLARTRRSVREPHQNHDRFPSGFDWLWAVLAHAAREWPDLTVDELQRALSIMGEMVDLDCDGQLSQQRPAERPATR